MQLLLLPSPSLSISWHKCISVPALPPSAHSLICSLLRYIIIRILMMIIIIVVTVLSFCLFIWISSRLSVYLSIKPAPLPLPLQSLVVRAALNDGFGAAAGRHATNNQLLTCSADRRARRNNNDDHGGGKVSLRSNTTFRKKKKIFRLSCPSPQHVTIHTGVYIYIYLYPTRVVVSSCSI